MQPIIIFACLTKFADYTKNCNMSDESNDSPPAKLKLSRDLIKEGEIKEASSPPPELPSKPAPRIDDGSGAKVEAAIQSMQASACEELRQETGEAPCSKHTFRTSILVLLLLLLVLIGAGYGLWRVLQSPAEAEATPANPTAAATTETPIKGPIQKAREAIASVPVADFHAMTRAEIPETSPAETPPAETPPAEPSPVPRSALSPQDSFAPPPPPSSSALEASKQEVAQYLSAIHIGGVRQGERPMILIGGESFPVGALVHPETGLKFDGFRNGKLAFRDHHGIVYLKSF